MWSGTKLQDIFLNQQEQERKKYELEIFWLKNMFGD